MALGTVRAARGVESISDDALPQTASPPTPLVVAESLNDVVRHARVALVWTIVQAAAILDHEQPAFGRQPAAPLRAALVGDDNFASPDQRCVVIITRELDRKSTRLNSSHICASRLPLSACTQNH